MLKEKKFNGRSFVFYRFIILLSNTNKMMDSGDNTTKSCNIRILRVTNLILSTYLSDFDATETHFY